MIEMLSEGIATSRGRRGALLHRDQVNHRLARAPRRAADRDYQRRRDSGNAQYQVIAEPEGTDVGTLDEDFAIESLAGDMFLLGTTSWRIKRVETGRVRVEDAHGAAPSIPFWHGEAPGRTLELSRRCRQLREEVAVAREGAIELLSGMRLDRRGAEQAVEYVQRGCSGRWA